MNKPAKNCDECRHFFYHVGADMRECQKGHKPRFYSPVIAVRVQDWGWKRRCDDFREAGQP